MSILCNTGNGEPETPTLFSFNSESNGINQEEQIESKFQERQEKFSNQENFSEIKEKVISNEISLGNNNRSKVFMQRRLKKKINSEEVDCLKNILTIPQEVYNECSQMEVLPSDFKGIIETFKTEDIITKYKGLVGIRKLLSISNEAPIQEIIDIGIIPELILILEKAPPEFQYESLWCLTNIATGTTDQANSIVVKGGVPIIISLMDSNVEELKNQAVWTIGNLASDSQKIRDILIKEKAFNKILTLMASTSSEKIIKTCAWTISNFCRIKPPPPYENMKKSIKVISRSIVLLPENIEFLTDASYILSFSTEFYKEIIKDLLDIDILPNIIKTLEVSDAFVIHNCLRIIGNIASGNANQTQKLLDLKVLDYLKKTINNPKKAIRKETAWIISNIAAGTQKQIETLINEDFLPILIKSIHEDEIEIKKEAIWGMCNLTSIESEKYMKKILKQGILGIVCECLKMNDTKIIAVCLEALANLLSYGKRINPLGRNQVIDEIEKMGMFDTLEKLQTHPVEIIYEKTLKILETFFDIEGNL